MNEAPSFDKVSFPGGYDYLELDIAVSLSALRHSNALPEGEASRDNLLRFLRALAERHPEEQLPFDDPYLVRARELFEERPSLLHSHLRFSWFALAYWAHGLMAVRSGASVAIHDGLRMFLTPVQRALRELGVVASEEECLEEIDRFTPADSTPRILAYAAQVFLSFVRFLHLGALRRRQLVRVDLALPGVYLASAEVDAKEARNVIAFLTTHGVPIIEQAAEMQPTDRLLVLMSTPAMASEPFWRALAEWRQRQVVPMVLCLMPRAEFYREPESQGTEQETWAWLATSVAVERSDDTDRYIPLLRALEATDRKQWWWQKGDAVELGPAVDVLGTGIPRPRTHRAQGVTSGAAYPIEFNRDLVLACVASGPRPVAAQDVQYVSACLQLEALRKAPNGRPYDLPWFVLAYRARMLLSVTLREQQATEAEVSQLGRELQMALFALGVGSQAGEPLAFLRDFADLPWSTGRADPYAVDVRAIAFVVLVHELCQASLTRTQRARLNHPRAPCFVSYARSDEAFARELVVHLEAKGADVWWDLNSITLGTPLRGALNAAVGSSTLLFVVASPAADESPYVRLELEAAIEYGHRIVPIALGNGLPEAIRTLLARSPDSVAQTLCRAEFEPSELFHAALAKLERSPAEQVGWLESRPLYRELHEQLAQARRN